MLEVRFPEAPLNQFVECLFYHQDINPPHSIDRFLPDGNTEIIIDLTETPKYIYDNETLIEKQKCINAWASGVRTEYISIPSGQDSCMLVIYFRKGMAYPFFPLPMNEMSDRVIDTDLLWGRSFEGLRYALLDEKDLDRRFSIVEQFLIDNYLANANLNPCISFAVEQMQARPSRLELTGLYKKIGYSQKHFTDMFKSHVGVTPKAYLRILRFQKALAKLKKAKI